MFKKVLLTIVMSFMFCSVVLATVDVAEITFDVVTSGTFDQSLRRWIDTLNTDITNAGVLSNVGTGNIYFVDSVVGDDNYVGTKPEWAVATMDAATDLCTDSNGDIVFFIQGHDEDLTETDDATCDVAGVTYVGLGAGSLAANFAFTEAAAIITVSATNVSFYNLRFVAEADQIATGITVTSGGDGFRLLYCNFPEPATSTHEFLEAVNLDGGADDCVIRFNKYYHEENTGPTYFIDMGNDRNWNNTISDNEISGEFSVAPIFGDVFSNGDNGLRIERNRITQLTSGQFCIECTGDATGWCVGNILQSDDPDTCLDSGNMVTASNMYSDGTDESAQPIPRGVSPRGFLEALMGRQIRAVAGSAEPIRIWWVDGGIGTSGDGRSPITAFDLLSEAITACDNSVDDWILIQDYSGQATETTINKSFVHIIGYGPPGMPYPRIQGTTAGQAGLVLGDAADQIEIANLFLAATTTSAAVEFNGSGGSFNVWIHNCIIGRNGNVARDGIDVGAGVGGAAPHLVVEDCIFGGAGGVGITRNGIRIGNNATCGIARRNIFRKCGTQAIYLLGGVESFMVLDNTFQLPSDTEGYAVTASASTNYCLIMGNRASSHTGLLRTEVFHDDDTTSTNSWAGNTGGGLDTLIKQSERIVAARRGLIPGSSTLPVRIWYVDYNATTGNGFTPFTPFKTIQEAMTVASDTVDDYIIVFDYSGGTAATITIANAFVHLIGWNPSNTCPYPRIMPSSAVAGITITDAGDRVEICNFVIGGGNQTVPAITFSGGGGSYGVWIHDNVIGRDATAPANDGILVPAGTGAPYCKFENNIFHGSATAGIDECGIEIAGNATRGQILNNLFMDIGTSTHPAINLSGSATQMMVEGNRIAGKDDGTQGWGIYASANVSGCWFDGNHAGSSNDNADSDAYEDAASDEINFWGLNMTDVTFEMPADD